MIRMCKYNERREKKKRSLLVFLFRAASYLRGLPQIYIQTSEINKVYFFISQRVQCIFAVYRKYNER